MFQDYVVGPDDRYAPIETKWVVVGLSPNPKSYKHGGRRLYRFRLRLWPTDSLSPISLELVNMRKRDLL